MTRKALFLDRDGVINVDLGYVHRPDQVTFVPGVFELVREARALDYVIVVVTNQAGIGRGYYTEAEFAALSDWMRERFVEQAGSIDAIYHCPDHPEHGIGAYRRESAWRKPNPGMLLQASADHGLSLAASVLVGDKESDILAGINAGVGTTVLLAAHPQPGRDGVATRADAVVRSLVEVIELLHATSDGQRVR